MTEAFASVDGQGLTAVRLTVANTGPWFAECEFEGAPPVQPGARAALDIGDMRLVGTVSLTYAGTHGERRKCSIVAGGNGWGQPLAAKSYHNDAGVKARLIAEDAARAVGETLGVFVPASERLAADYVRQAGRATRALEDAAGVGVPWFVDFAGVTQIGPRPAVPLDATRYEVLAYDPRLRLVTLTADQLGAVVIGSVLSEGLDAPQTVREYEISVSGAEVRVKAWCGGADASRGHLADLLTGIATAATDRRLTGLYRYRVVRMAGDRAELQAARKSAGLPDIIPVSIWPGVPGVAVTLTPGTAVLVAFIEGDRTMPVVTHFAGPGGDQFVPVGITIGGPDGSGQPAARSGDSVEVLLPPGVFTGSIGGVPAQGVVSWLIGKTLGTILTGSAKVDIA